jgi:HEAT repeat protein
MSKRGRRVNAALTATFELLAKTKNEAAVPMLISALDSTSPVVATAAVRAILQRRCPTGMRQLVGRFHEMSDQWREVIREFHGRLLPALRDAVLSGDVHLVENGCDAARLFCEYDLIPTLLVALEDDTNPYRETVARTLIDLADALFQDLAGERDERRRRDPQLSRRNAVSALEASVRRFPRHQRLEPIEAFLQLTTRDNAALTGLLNDVRESTFVPLLQVLHGSNRPGVLRLLIGFLDDARPPSAGLASLFRRNDRRCVDALLRKFHGEPSQTTRHNLRHVDHVGWLGEHALIDELEDGPQQAVVRLATTVNLKRDEIVKVLEHLALRGKPGARRAALEALRPFNGADANTVVLRALRDNDVYVRAAALGQLRPRGIPGALSTLIDALDSPSRPERDAARANLEEFNLKRFLPAFDMLEEEVRKTTAALVRKIDYTAPQLLREELESPQAKRRMRALRMIAAMDLAKDLEEAVLLRADDDDHLVRVEAVRVLSGLTTASTQEKLLALAADSSYAVREAAWNAIEESGRGGGLSLEELERLRESFSEQADAAHRASQNGTPPAAPSITYPQMPPTASEVGYGG